LILLKFVTSQTNRDDLAGFSTIPDFFGHSGRVRSTRFSKTWVRGIRLAGSDSYVRRYLFNKRGCYLVPSTEALEYLEYLVRNKTISDTTRSRKDQLKSWIPIHIDCSSVSDPQHFDEQETFMTFDDFLWHLNSFYCLKRVPDFDTSTSTEAWRSHRQRSDEKSNYRVYSCSCDLHRKYLFCEHALALALVKRDMEIPLCRNPAAMGNVPQRGRPSLSRVNHFGF